MPLDADQTAELKQLIGVSRKRALNFGICLGSTPESTVLVLHRQRSSDVLMREAKKAGDTAKVACGTMETSGNVVTLTCPEAPPANLARATKQFLATVGVKAKVTILGANGETLDSDEDEEGEGTETTEEGPEAPDPYEEKWKLVEAQLTPLVARAASESKVADPSQLRAAWAYALENAREGDFAGALKVAIRVKASIDEGGGEGDPAKLAFKAAIKKLEPRVLAALKGRAGPFEKVRLVWEFAHGKADAAPPDFAAANKALAALVPLLDEADKALEANKGTADTPEGIREGTVDKRQKEIKTGKQILTELAGMNAALKLALIHQPDQADAVKALIAEIQKSVSTNDLDNANVAMFKLENIPYHARQHRDREAAKIVDEVKALGGEIGRQLALPPETAIVVRVQRVLTALPARIPQEAAKDDLSQARIVLRDLKAAIAEMKAEEPQIANAAALRAQAEREFKALQPALGAARLIHKVSPAFKEDRKAFQELDKEVGGHLHTHAWARALADMPLLEAAAKKLNDRRGEFDQALVDEVAAAKAVKSLAKLVEKAKKTPLTQPDAQVLRDRMEAEHKVFEEAHKAKDWGKAVADAAICTQTANDLIALFADCTARVAQRDKIYADFLIVDARMTAALPKVDVLPEMVRLRTEVNTLREAFAETYNTIRDLDECQLQLDRLSKVVGQIEALKVENDAAAKRKAAFKAAYNGALPAIKAALKIKPASPEFLAVYEKFKADYNKLWDAYSTGDPEAQEALDAVLEDLKALDAGKAADAAGSGTAKAAAEAKIKAIAARVTAGQALCAEHAPALDGPRILLNEAVDALNGARKNKRWAELEKAIAETGAACDAVEAAAKKAEPDTAKIKEAFEARYNATLKAQIVEVLDYEELTATLVADQAAIDTRVKETDKLVAAKEWTKATASLTALEPLVGALVAFKPQYDTIMADAMWLAGQMPSLEPRMKAVEAFEEVTRDVAVATRAIKAFLDAYEKKSTAMDIAGMRAGFPQLVAHVEALERQKAAHDAAKQKKTAADQAWKAVEAKADKARAFNGYTKELTDLIRVFDEAEADFDASYFGYDYDTAILRAPRVGVAADALIAKQAEHDAAKSGATAKASKALTALTAASVEDISKLDSGKQVELLEQLRAEKGELTPEQRAAQRKVYAAMKIDPVFKEADEKRRKELGKSIRKDKELMEAKDKWADVPIADRLRLLERTLKSECAIYGMPVPEVRTFSEPPGDEGFFDPVTNAISLNIHEDADFHDFYECIDTIVHENAHNYQEYMVTKLAEGLIKPGDPDYKQALMFAANSGGGDYVDSDEDKAIYKKQPLEEHAWATGKGIAALLQLDEDEEDLEV